MVREENLSERIPDASGGPGRLRREARPQLFVVDLARWEARQGVDRLRLDVERREPARLDQDPPYLLLRMRGRVGCQDASVVADHGRLDPARGQRMQHGRAHV